MNKERETSNRNGELVAYCSLFVVSIFFLWNLLRPGFYVTQDAEWYAIRLTAVYQTLRSGQFPVRWTPRLNHEYGYPVMNFNYPFPFYAAIPVYAVTKDAAFSLEVVMAMAVVSAAIGMLKLLWSEGRWEGFLGAILFAFSPYMAFDLYQRGSFGEIVAMGIAPWIFWSLKKKYWPLSACFIALLITSHNVLAFLFFPLILLFCIFQARVHRIYFFYDLATHAFLILLSLGLSAFFWFPALSELPLVRISRFPVSDFFSEYLTNEEVLKRAGIPAVLFTAGAPLFLSTDISRLFWNAFPTLQVVQFPWRTFAPLTFLAAIVAPFSIRKVTGYLDKRLVVCFFIFLSFSSTYQFLKPQGILNRPRFFYETNDDSSTIRQEYTPIWVKELPSARPVIPTQHYYPGWRAFTGSEDLSLLEPQITGGILKAEPKAFGLSVIFRWGETRSRTIANLSSAFSFLVLIFWYQKLAAK